MRVIETDTRQPTSGTIKAQMAALHRWIGCVLV
jgi:hypothetical protein